MKQLVKEENIILNKSIEFSLEIINFCENLATKRKYVIANQILKSGTSIGANIHEVQNAESKIDFIPKMKIAVKELEETKYWLTLCEKSESYDFQPILREKLNELGLILYKIISTSKKY